MLHYTHNIPVEGLGLDIREVIEFNWETISRKHKILMGGAERFKLWFFLSHDQRVFYFPQVGGAVFASLA